jgi:hypothetical protein
MRPHLMRVEELNVAELSTRYLLYDHIVLIECNRFHHPLQIVEHLYYQSPRLDLPLDSLHHIFEVLTMWTLIQCADVIQILVKWCCTHQQ